MNQKAPKEIPDWLKDVQNHSYMPELLISGAILLVLFSLDKHLITFCFDLKDMFSFSGSNILIGIVTISSFSSLTALKFILIIHLALRMIWVGLIGMSYAYPDGINYTKTNFKGFFNKGMRESQTPTNAIIALEKVCSLAYSFAIMYIFIIAGFSIIIGLIGFSLVFYKILGILLFLIFIVYLIDLLSKYRIRNTRTGYYLILPGHFLIRTLGLGFLYRKVLHTFQSHIGLYKTLSVIVVFMLLGIMSSVETLAGFLHWNDVKEMGWFGASIQDNDYEDRLDKIPLDDLSLESYYICDDQSLTVFVLFNFLRDDSQIDSSSVPGDANRYELIREYNKYLNQLNRIYIDDSLYTDLSWVLEEHIITSQPGCRSKINIDHLGYGKHFVMFEKKEEHFDQVGWNFKEAVMFEKVPKL